MDEDALGPEGRISEVTDLGRYLEGEGAWDF